MSVWGALLLTALAGMSTALGALLALGRRKPGGSFLAYTLGLSAGVMVLVSFVELLSSSTEMIGTGRAYASFFAGMLAMGLVDIAVPHVYFAEEPRDKGVHDPLMRTGLLLALGIGIHNFPEGMATFAGSLKEARVGLAIALAVGLHNIPEGLAVSLPIYAATGDRWKAFRWSLLSGLAEPAGAVFAAAFFARFLSESLLGWTLGAVAGVMVYISLDELVPASRSYGRDHLAILGAGTGMAVMALSLHLI